MTGTIVKKKLINCYDDFLLINWYLLFCRCVYYLNMFYPI